MYRKKSEKKRGKRGPLIFFALLKNTSATPISLLLIKRSGTPPSLPILGVALKRVPLFNKLLIREGNAYFFCKISSVSWYGGCLFEGLLLMF